MDDRLKGRRKTALESVSFIGGETQLTSIHSQATFEHIGDAEGGGPQNSPWALCHCFSMASSLGPVYYKKWVWLPVKWTLVASNLYHQVDFLLLRTWLPSCCSIHYLCSYEANSWATELRWKCCCPSDLNRASQETVEKQWSRDMEKKERTSW